MKCTIKHTSTKEFQNMKRRYGEETAIAVFEFLNKDLENTDAAIYATPETYDSVLLQMEAYSMDSVDRAYDQERIERYEGLIAKIKPLTTTWITSAQTATLNKLVAMYERAIADTKAVMDENRKQNEDIEEGEPRFEKKSTISVSRYIGATVFNVTPTSDFKHFGIFVHDVLEELSAKFPKLKNSNSETFSSLITLEQFQKIHDKWQNDKKQPFVLPGYTIQMMYDDVQAMSNLVLPYLKEGYIILPEVTVIGKNKFDTLIAGRIDVMLVNTDGRIKVVDFKTKKVENLISPFTKAVNIDNAHYKLAANTYPVNDLQDSIKELSGSRSAMDLWQTQLKAYQNILIQAGIEVEDSQIIALLYDYDKAGNNVTGSQVVSYSSGQMYHRATSMKHADGKVFDVATAEKRIQKVQDILNKYIPISEEEQIAEDERLSKRFPFDLNEKNWNKLQSSLKILTDNSIDSVRTKLSSARQKDNKVLTNVYETRLKSLESFKSLILTPTKFMTSDESDAIASAVKAGYVVETLREELELLNDNSTKVFESLKPFLKDISKLKDKEYARLQAEHQNIVELLSTLDPLVRFLREVVADQSGNDINKFSEMTRELNDFSSMQERILTRNREISFYVTMIFISATLDTKNTVIIDNKVYQKSDTEKLGEQMRQSLAPIINTNKRKAQETLDKITSDSVRTTLSNIDFKYGSAVVTVNELIRIAPVEDIKYINEYYDYMTKVAANELAIEYNFKLSSEVVEQGLQAIQDPHSPFYLGHSGLWGEQRTILGTNFNSIFRKFSGSEWIASASNSNPIISAISLFLKNAEAIAVLDGQNNEDFIEFDRQLDSYGKGKSTEQINEKITEVAKYTYFNNREGKIESYERLSFVAPFSEEYSSKTKGFDIEIKNKTLSLRRAKEKRADLIKQEIESGTSQSKAITDISNEIKQLQHDIEQAKLDQLNFIKEFGTARFSDMYYEYLSLYPADLRVRINELYEEIELIRLQYDRFSDEQIEFEKEDDYRDIKDIEIEIKTIRRKAIKENPELERRFLLAKDLFEVKPNTALFERVKARKRVEYTNNEKMFDNWIRDNTVEVYHQEYYAQVQELRERLIAIYGKDETYKNLLKKAGVILAPHRTLGYLDPRFLTVEKVEAYEEVQKEINLYEQGRPKLELPSDLQAERNAILEKLSLLREYKLNNLYITDRDAKTDKLYKLKANLDAAVQDYNNAKASRAKSDVLLEAYNNVTAARNNFNAYEDEYEKWFNLHHISSKVDGRTNRLLPAYTSITLGFDPITQSQPKQFNYVLAPSDFYKDFKGSDGLPYVQQRPSPTFDIRVKTDLAYNDKYKELPGKIPLPKSLKMEGNKVTINYEFLNTLSPEKRSQHEAMINPKFKTLHADKEAFDFYNAITNSYFNLQQQTEGKKLGYMVPGAQASLLEQVKNKGLTEGVRGAFQTWTDENWRKMSKSDTLTNQYGDLGRKLRFRYNDQYGANMQSIDAVSAVKAWIQEAHYNMSMHNAQPIVENVINYFEGQVQQLTELYRDSTGSQKDDFSKRITDMEDIVKIGRAEADKFLYGITDDTGSRKAKKIITNVMTYASMIRIGFDIPVQMKNYISGNVQIFLSAESSTHYATDDYWWAQKELFGNFMGKWLKNFGKTHPDDIEVAMYRFFNPAQKDQQYYANDTSDKDRKIANQLTTLGDLSHFLQDRGDTQISVTVWLAMMKARKFPMLDINKTRETGQKAYQLDADGNIKYTDAYNAMEIDSSGKLQIRPDVDATLEEMLSLRNNVIGEVRRTQGNYAASDKTYNERFFWGAIMYFYKKYLIPLFLNRLGYLRPSYEMKEMQYGYYRAVISVIKHHGWLEGLKGVALAGIKKDWMRNSQIEEFYLGKLSQASREMWMSLALAGLSMITLGYVKSRDDEDEEPLDLITGNAIRVLWGVERETLSMNPFPVIGGADEYIRNFTSVTSLTREATAMSRTLTHALALTAVKALGDEEPDKQLDNIFEEAYETMYRAAYYSKKSGAYEKGDAKLLKDFHDLSGAKSFRDMLNPYDKLEMMMKQRY